MPLRCGRGSARWDLQTGNTAGDSLRIPGFASANAANRLQAFAAQVRSADFALLGRPPCEFCVRYHNEKRKFVSLIQTDLDLQIRWIFDQFS